MHKAIPLRIVLFIYAISFSLFACAGNASLKKDGPQWIGDPYSKYDRQLYLAAVGNGGSRQIAEKNALGNLAAFFGQAIKVDETVSTIYLEAAKKGTGGKWSESIAVDNTIATSAGLDYLIGAEISDTWNNGSGDYYALALLSKTRAVQSYSGMIDSNYVTINKLTNMNDAEKNSFEGYSRYMLAAAFADINANFGNILSVLGAPGLSMGLKKGEDYRLEAAAIARTIPIEIKTENDVEGKIHGAFTRAVSGAGFQSGTGSHYLLSVKINSQEIDLPANPNKFTRVEIIANLIDTVSAAVILPYNLSVREGHLTQIEADRRAFSAAEKKIDEEYPMLLNDYAVRLLPDR